MGRSEHFAEGTKQHYRHTRALPSDSFPGIVRHPRGELPHEVVAHHAILGPENDKHGWQWQHTPREVVQPTETIHTGQPYVGEEHVQRYAGRRSPSARTPIDFRDKGASDEDQDDGSPRLLRFKGELWHMDGLHRTAAARQLGRPFKARIFDADAHQAGVAAQGAEPAPRTRYDVVNHVTEGHIGDNEAISSDHHDPNYGNYGPGEDHRWTDSDLHEYHASLHEGGVADHRHH